MEAQLKQDAGKKREADRLDQERTREREEKEAKSKAYQAKLEALEPAYGEKVDALSPEDIADIAKRDLGVRRALKANPRPRDALLLAFSTHDGHSKQLPTAPELAPGEA